ncbi:hypothetical protein DL93DRAFT_2089419, partial [Clavulina sp. PMI_390]
MYHHLNIHVRISITQTFPAFAVLMASLTALSRSWPVLYAFQYLGFPLSAFHNSYIYPFRFFDPSAASTCSLFALPALLCSCSYDPPLPPCFVSGSSLSIFVLPAVHARVACL